MYYRGSKIARLIRIFIGRSARYPQGNNPIRRKPVINYNEYPFRQADRELTGGPNKILIADLRSANLRKSTAALKRFMVYGSYFLARSIDKDYEEFVTLLATFKIIRVTSKFNGKSTASKKQRLATTLIMTAREISDRTASIDRDAARMANSTRPRPSSGPRAKETSSSETVASFQKIDQHTASCRGACRR